MGTRSMLDRELAIIRDNVIRMSSLVDEAIERSYRALRLHDVNLAQTVINDDANVDDLCTQIENKVELTVALQQPTALDLRRVLADLLITTELERMGDHAEGISRTVVRFDSDVPMELPTQLRVMKDGVRDMIRRSMDAYVTQNVELAEEVGRLDEEVDHAYRELFDLLVGSMGQEELSVEHGTYLLWAGHNLERIGDRATNICERIIYSRTGDVSQLNP
ncbi:MAG: phosphate signaling complex protein PhoU [Chloroflexota bacterium]